MATTPTFLPAALDFGIVAPTVVLSASVGSNDPLTAATTASAVIVTPVNALGLVPLPAFTVTSVGPQDTGSGGIHVPPPQTGAGTGTGVLHLPQGHLASPRRVTGGGGTPGPVGPITSGKSAPVTGSVQAGEYLVVEIEFTAGPSAPVNDNSTLVISSPQWSSDVSIPLSAQVAWIPMSCAPSITVVQSSSVNLKVTVGCAGPATTATFMTSHESWPQGVSVSIQPATLDLVPAQSQTVTVEITAQANALASTSNLIIYGTGFGNLECSCQTSVTVKPLVFVLKPSPIAAKYNSLSSSIKTLLGSELAPEQFCSDNKGQFRGYQHGAIYWDGTSADAFVVYGAVLDHFLYFPATPPPTPSVADYAAIGAPGYPITDTEQIAAGAEIRLENDFGIYSTALGTYGVPYENTYRADGGSTGALGLPLAEANYGFAGFSAGTQTQFTYQDFENGAIFFPSYATSSSAATAEPIAFGAPGGSPAASLTLKAAGQNINASLYTQQNAPKTFGFSIPLWALATITDAQVIQLVESSVNAGIAGYNKTASNSVQLTTFASPLVLDYTTLPNQIPSRTYQVGFGLYGEAGDGIVGGVAVVQFDLFFWVELPSADAPGTTALRGTLINTSINWTQDGLINIPQSVRDQSTAKIEALLQSQSPFIPLPLTYQYPIPAGSLPGGPYIAPLTLNWISCKVLANGTLCLFTTLQVGTIQTAS